MMKAFVLIHGNPGSLPEIVRNLKRINSVAEAHMTFGPYDVVAIVQATDIKEMGQLIATQIQPIPGILDTMTCLVTE